MDYLHNVNHDDSMAIRNQLKFLAPIVKAQACMPVHIVAIVVAIVAAYHKYSNVYSQGT